MDNFTPIRGKCVWWREAANTDDAFDLSVKGPQKRIECSCFVEGARWTFITVELPAECPEYRRCRYYTKGY